MAEQRLEMLAGAGVLAVALGCSWYALRQVWMRYKGIDAAHPHGMPVESR